MEYFNGGLKKSRCFSRRGGDIYSNGIIVKAKPHHQVVGLAKQYYIILYIGGCLWKERHTRTSLLRRAVDLAFQEHPRQRRGQYLYETIWRWSLIFSWKVNRVYPHQTRILFVPINLELKCEIIVNRWYNTHRSILWEPEGEENDQNGNGESRVESGGQDVFRHFCHWHRMCLQWRHEDIQSTRRNGACIQQIRDELRGGTVPSNNIMEDESNTIFSIISDSDV